MVIGKRPVHKVKVNISQLQILKAFPAGIQHLPFSVPVIPYLGGDKKLLALHNPFVQHTLKHLTDTILILVYGSAVYQTIACFYAAVYSLDTCSQGRIYRNRRFQSPTAGIVSPV